MWLARRMAGRYSLVAREATATYRAAATLPPVCYARQLPQLLKRNPRRFWSLLQPAHPRV